MARPSPNPNSGQVGLGVDSADSILRDRRLQFGRNRSLSQYAVSLPSQPDDIHGIHPRDDRFRFFQAGRDFQAQHSKHRYTADELRVLETYESADNLPSHTEVYRQWLEELPTRSAETWYLVAIVGVAIGIITFLIKEACEKLQIFGNSFIGSYIERGETYRLWVYYATLNCTLACLSALICVYICPWAGGSGLPEIIGILNGCVIRNMLSLKNLVCKILSTTCTVLSCLPVGFEGPMIHIGAMIASQMARPFELKCNCVRRIRPVKSASSIMSTISTPKNLQAHNQNKSCGLNLCRYRDCKARHNLICMGAAAGVSSAFSAPITGLLFSMEEMSSFWTNQLTWQTFVCCIISRSTTELLRSLLSGLYEHKLTIAGFEFSESALFDMKVQLRLYLLMTVPTVILGVFGGLIGSVFIIYHLKVARFRRKLLAKVSRPEILNVIKFLEPMFLALVASAIIMGSLRYFPCQNVEYTTTNLVNPHEQKYLFLRSFQCEKELKVEYQTDTVIQTGQYHEMATLVFGPWEQMVRNLFSRKTAMFFSWKSLICLLVFFFIFSSWTSLTSIAAGLLIPQLAIGALYGRLFGVIMCEMFGTENLTPVEEKYWEWMDPGAFALLGAASFMAGTSRLPVTSVVMLIEMTNDINMSLLIMIVVMLSKFVGGLFTHPLYHSMCEFKCIPYLDPQPVIYHQGKRVNLELFKAADVMASPVHCVNVNESLKVLANLLLDTNHGGFPVVISEYGFKRTFLGVITRLELTILLTKTVSFTTNELGRDDIDRIRISYPEYSSSKISDTETANRILNIYAEDEAYNTVRVNLLPYINTSSYSIPSQFSLERAYMMFRTLGIRHLLVTDQHNQVMGMITRKDLMLFMIDSKLKKIIERNGIPRDTFSSPVYEPNGRGGKHKKSVQKSNKGKFGRVVPEEPRLEVLKERKASVAKSPKIGELKVIKGVVHPGNK